MKKVGKAIIGTVAIVVLGGLGMGVFLVTQGGRAEAKNAAQEDIASRLPVVVTPAKQMTFESRVVVSGNVQAKNFALVSARMPGPLDAVFVDEGDVVEAGKTQLFQTDSVKLSKAVALARQGLTVAECSVREKQAFLEQSLAHNDQAAKDLERYRELSSQNAISEQMYEQQGSQLKQAGAMVKHKQALISLATAELEQAKLSLIMAEKDMADSLVMAPINGKVSERMMEPGEMAAPGTPIVRIEDLTILEISVHVPEEFYAQVEPGQAKMRINVSGIDLGSYPVTYKSPTVHPKLRTFEVKGIVETPPDGVVPGCLAEVEITLDGRPGIGVPTDAIQRRGDEKVVFVADKDQARMIPVTAGREFNGWTEVTAADLVAGMPVITMGQAQAEEGTAVSLVEEDAQ
jgi:RND family efflux transporter MFP subunit